MRTIPGLGVLLELVPQEKAVELHQEFKRDVIAERYYKRGRR